MMPLVRIQPQPLSQLLQGFAEVPPAQDVAVCGVDSDSRRLRAGAAFLACVSQDGKRHGLEHLEASLQRGIAALLWEPQAGREPPSLDMPVVAVQELARHAGAIAARSLGDPSADLAVVGVTGTDGKTSVAHLLAQAKELLGGKSAYLGTLGYGALAQLAEATHTTPDAVAMQHWLAWLRDNGFDSVAMEVSSHALDQGRADAVHFNIALLTNLSRDHLDYHGDEQRYQAAKRRLFDMPSLDAAVLNQDDPVGNRWLGELQTQGVHTVAFGRGSVPDARADAWVLGQIHTASDGLRLEIDSAWGRGAVDAALLGDFNAMNLLAVIAVLLQSGYAFEDVLAVVPQLRAVPGRMERVLRTASGALVVVDYAHTPKALESALKTLRDHVAGQLICVFGCGGDRDRGKRPLMGAAAEAHADRLFITDDNPRSEQPVAIVREILAGLQAPKNAVVIHDRRRAIAEAIKSAGAGDLVLVAGKGHEDYQIVGNERREFDDRAVVRALAGQEGAAC